MGFLTDDELHKLAFEHKYHVEGCSILDGLVMQSFWRWLVEFLPLKHDPKAAFHWTAPNTITLVGLVCMITPASIMLWYSGDLVTPVPSWIYVTNAAMIFVYQTMDALDGKQARRTGSSSPFGELFDHGCDSVSTIFCMMAIVCICQDGVSWLSFSMLSGSLLSFHACHIQAYFLGHVTFGLFDVTELQVGAIGVNLVAAVDPYFASKPLFGGVPARVVPAAVVMVGSAVAIAFNLWHSFRCPRKPEAPSSPLHLWGFTLLLFAAAAAWLWAQQASMPPTDFVLLLLTLGFTSSIQSVAVIAAHMSSSAFPLRAHLFAIPILLGAGNAVVGAVPAGAAVRAVFATTMVLWVHYCASVSRQIARFLGIDIFKVGAPTRQPPQSAQSKAK